MQSQRLAPGSQKAAEARQCVAGSSPLHEVPGRPLHQAVKVKAKRLWVFRNVVAEGTIGCPLRKAVGTERSEPSREAPYATGSGTKGWGCMS